MLNIEELKEWCWANLQFSNCPENVEETFVEDIINGYQGTCHDYNGKFYSYSEIRQMFEEHEENE